MDPATGCSLRTKENAVSAMLNLIQCGREDFGNSLREMMMGLSAFDGIEDVAQYGTCKGKNKAIELLKSLDAWTVDSRFESLLSSHSS